MHNLRLLLALSFLIVFLDVLKMKSNDMMIYNFGTFNFKKWIEDELSTATNTLYKQ